jgi:hypothetical protein
MLPPIRPTSANRAVDSATKVQLQEHLRDNSGTSDPEIFMPGAFSNYDKEDQLAHDAITALNHTEGEHDVTHDVIPSSATDVLLCSSGSQTEIEDPEKEYWRVHSRPPKNASNVTKDALERMQTASTSKKLDLSEIDLVAIPEKVHFQ